MRQVILASGSRYRQNQLSALGMRFDCHVPRIDETPLPSERPLQTASRLALYKAQAVASNYPEALIIGCDQTGDLDGALLGKPVTHSAAIAQLQAMSGKIVHFHSAIAVLSSEGQWQACVRTDVTFRTLTLSEIEYYLARDKPYDCAGSFKIEAAGTLLMKSVRSDDPSALIGLPLIALAELMRCAGVDPLLA